MVLFDKHERQNKTPHGPGWMPLLVGAFFPTLKVYKFHSWPGQLMDSSLSKISLSLSLLPPYLPLSLKSMNIFTYSQVRNFKNTLCSPSISFKVPNQKSSPTTN